MKIGLIINPVAGIGGPVGLKGSDGIEIQNLALLKGGSYQSNNKSKIALNQLKDIKEEIFFITGYGEMGERLLKELGFSYRVIGPQKNSTTYHDTEKLARDMLKHGVELLVFAGGDGTARNIYNAIALKLPCIGIPAGVKIHSAVYANNPKDAGIAIKQFIMNKDSISLIDSEVMDIDEEKFRQNIVEARLYGYLKVPYAKNLMQQSKASVKFSEYDIEGIADEVEDRIQSNPKDVCYVFGTGGTSYSILKRLGYKGSLLGVDVLYNGKLIIKDGTEQEIYDFVKNKEIVLILTVIGGQGHIFGRGNQQLSPRIIKLVRKENIWIVSTADKIYSLPGNVLRVDTSDEDLDKKIAGYYKVVVGWQEQIVCQVKA
jgi:predicted polyphosphate/ATP-dependent NAD kinase